MGDIRNGHLNGIKFRRQHPYGPYVLDFFSVDSGLAVELDGKIHDRREQKEYDLERTAFLEAQGLRVLRFRNEDVLERLDEVLKEIAEAASPTSNAGGGG